VNKKTAAGLDAKPINQRHKKIGGITISSGCTRPERPVTRNNEIPFCPTITQLRLEQKCALIFQSRATQQMDS